MEDKQPNDKDEDKKYFDFLDGLRESGQTNMYGAVPYLREMFPTLDESEAREILMEWMETFPREKNG